MMTLTVLLLLLCVNVILCDITAASSKNVEVASVKTNIDVLNYHVQPSSVVSSITSTDVLTALDNWGRGLVAIATAKANNEDYVAKAIEVINQAYNYNNGIVLFKPTVAAEIPFRTTFAGALSYFVGGNDAYPEDTGFALAPWKSVAFDVIGIVYDVDRAIVQTKTILTKQDNSTVMTYFSMGFTKEAATGDLKIDLHHSSLPPTQERGITRDEVITALDNWGRGLVAIATAKANNEDYVAVAIDAIRNAYNYDNGIVLFKPTVAADIPFRTTFAGALSYFVGGNPAYPEDKGFALSPWTNVAFEVIGIVYGPNRAIAQTKTTLTLQDGSKVVTYFSMGFSRAAGSGDLKIDLHHSSLPPAKAITRTEVLTALDNWGKGLVSIATAKANNEDYVAKAIEAINKAYNYENGLVLFKPTVAAEIPFRTTFAGALSYFVGGNSAYPEDKGFALAPWKNVAFEVEGIVYGSNRAIVQTRTTLTKQDDSSVVTYFSMGFTRDTAGDLKIDLHHSSLPPATAATQSSSTGSTDDEDTKDHTDNVSIAAIILACIGVVLALISVISLKFISIQLENNKTYKPVQRTEPKSNSVANAQSNANSELDNV